MAEEQAGWDLAKLPVDSIWGYKGVPYKIMRAPDADTLIQYNDVWYPCIIYRNAEYNGKTYYRKGRPDPGTHKVVLDVQVGADECN